MTIQLSLNFCLYLSFDLLYYCGFDELVDKDPYSIIFLHCCSKVFSESLLNFQINYLLEWCEINLWHLNLIRYNFFESNFWLILSHCSCWQGRAFRLIELKHRSWVDWIWFLNLNSWYTVIHLLESWFCLSSLTYSNFIGIRWWSRNFLIFICDGPDLFWGSTLLTYI